MKHCKKFLLITLSLVTLLSPFLTPVSVLAHSHQNSFTNNTYEDFQHPNERAKVTITVATIKKALSAIGGSKSYVPVTNHALQRMNSRGFTSNSVANLMKNGVKYRDTRTGARILYNPSIRRSLIYTNNSSSTTSAYDQVNLNQKLSSGRWIRGW